MKRNAALVTGVGGPSGIAATAALKSRGFAVTAIDMHAVQLSDHQIRAKMEECLTEARAQVQAGI